MRKLRKINERGGECNASTNSREHKERQLAETNTNRPIKIVTLGRLRVSKAIKQAQRTNTPVHNLINLHILNINNNLPFHASANVISLPFPVPFPMKVYFPTQLETHKANLVWLEKKVLLFKIGLVGRLTLNLHM